jgi:hypothetical protein
VAIGAGVACGGSAPGAPSAATADLTPVRASSDWTASTPEAEGLDRTRLGDLALRIRRGDFGRIPSLLVVRRGRLAVGEYFNGASAKLGQLVLDEGRWQGRQIVDSAWIHESTGRSARDLRVWGGHSFDYGYLWWLTSEGGADVVTASGALGQWIFVSARHQLVAVSTGDNVDGRDTAAVGFFFSHILPSVRD